MDSAGAYDGMRRSGAAGRTDSGTRFCMSCGRSISWDAQSCPFCYWTPGVRVALPAAALQVSSRKRLLLYACSLLVPFFGIIVGILYVVKDDKEHESVGTACLALGLVSVISLPVILSFLLYWAVIG